MKRDYLAGKRQHLQAELQARTSEEYSRSDSTSRRHPFLGMASHQDTVKFANESLGQFFVIHTHKMNRSFWIFLFVFGVWPLSILMNSRFQWVPMGIIDNNFDWYVILVLGCSGLFLFGYLLVTPRWIECNFHERALIYRIGGLRRFVFEIDLQDIRDVSVLKHFVVRRGGSRHDIPASGATALPVIGTKHTIKLTLQGGGTTYPFVTGSEVVVNEFVRRLTSQLPEAESRNG